MSTNTFVTGWPIGHSKSPLLHGFWLQEHGISGHYEPIAVAPDGFDDFIANLDPDRYAGGNVTIPHKEKAFQLIENLDEAARKIGAVNTIWFQDGVMHGGNTDAYGFAANLDQFQPRWRKGKKVLVLGAGGAARAVVYAVIKAGYEAVHIANRTVERAENLAQDFTGPCIAHSLNALENLLPHLDLLINTTSIGMGDKNGQSIVDMKLLSKSAIVTDIVYTPLKTPFLKDAELQGLQVVDGLGMLLHQAVPGFEKWYGLRPEVTDELRNHILETL